MSYIRETTTLNPSTLRATVRHYSIDWGKLCDWCGVKTARYFWCEFDRAGFHVATHLGSFCSDECHMESGPKVVEKRK